MYLWKMVSTFHKDYLNKSITISTSLNSVLSIIKPIVKLFTK